jgi:uroporphyrinogen-III synthase
MSGSAARALRTRIPVVAIGSQTADEARRAGFEVVAVAAVQSVDGLVEALASLP